MVNIYYIVEPMVKEKHWCEKYQQGIMKEANSKKDKIIPIFDFNNIPKNEVIIVNGVSKNFIESIILKIQKSSSQSIILAPIVTKQGIHSVAFNFYISFLEIAKKLSEDKSKIAYVGFNPSSLNDSEKIKGFLDAGCLKEAIYVNNGDLNETFNLFIKDITKYDSVICSNDIIGVALLNNEVVKNSKIKIGTIGNALISQEYKDRMLCYMFDCFLIGKESVNLAKYIHKRKNILNISIKIEGKKEKENLYISANENINMYQDKSINPLFKIEKILEISDDVDKNIIVLLRKNKTYRQIGNELALSESAIKYRLNRLYKASEVKNKKELLSLLKYLED